MLLLEVLFDFMLFVAYIGMIGIMYTLLNGLAWAIWKKPFIKVFNNIFFKNI